MTAHEKLMDLIERRLDQPVFTTELIVALSLASIAESIKKYVDNKTSKEYFR